MQNLSAVGRNAVSDISSRYNISQEAVEHMLIAVNNGSGTQAQFNCPELGGAGQWMLGGMVMVGDMFNNGLKQVVDGLCNELSNLLANEQVFPVLPAGTPGSHQWWPGDLGSPFSSGSQNNTRYALFVGRLAVEMNGQVTVYDTLDHHIGGVSQQQGSNTSLNFNSQYGTVPVSSLPVVAPANADQSIDTNFAASPQPDLTVTNQTSQNQSEFQDTQTSTSSSESNLQQPADTGAGNDVILLIEKLAQLHGAGVLSDEEFGAKKQELLARL